MKVDTFIKLGSLAFGVVQDERIRELFKIAHKGVKRRGFFDPPPLSPQAGPRSQSRYPYGNFRR